MSDSGAKVGLALIAMVTMIFGLSLSLVNVLDSAPILGGIWVGGFNCGISITAFICLLGILRHE